MYKTQQDIEDDFFTALKDTELVHSVSGKLYKDGMRPEDSKLEDINLKVTTLDSEQYQAGVISIVVYCNGIDLYKSQVVPPKQRIKELSSLLLNIRDELASTMKEYDDFKFFMSITNDFDTYTEQYFVSTKISFRYLTI